jgi:hypothetical protein
MIAAQVIPHVGWPAFYLLAALLLIAAILPFARSGLKGTSPE